MKFCYVKDLDIPWFVGMVEKEPRLGWGEYHYDHEIRHYEAENCPLCKQEDHP